MTRYGWYKPCPLLYTGRDHASCTLMNSRFHMCTSLVRPMTACLPSPTPGTHARDTLQLLLKFYYAISLPALFPIGLPNPPTGLSSSPQAANTLRLQWEVPFSLPGENNNYILHARNLRTDTTVRRMTVTRTSTTFERPQEDQACDRYEFTVCSKNAVGPSDNCTAVEASTPSGEQSC